MRALGVGSWWLVVSGCAIVAVVAAAEPVRGADPDKGKLAFDQCAACHSLGEPGDFEGPMLKGVFGRKAGSLEDYRYSAAMKRSGVTWDAASLDNYITDPQTFIPGNRMAFAGISDKDQRDDLIAYLIVATK
jgi:cytochrome c